MAKALSRNAKCPECGEIIRAGETFVWARGSRATRKPGLRVEAWMPAHPFNCFAVKAARIERERAAETEAVRAAQFEDGLRLLIQYGASQLAIDTWRSQFGVGA